MNWLRRLVRVALGLQKHHSYLQLSALMLNRMERIVNRGAVLPGGQEMGIHSVGFSRSLVHSMRNATCRAYVSNFRPQLRMT
jgi:hypothetical protein